MNAPSVLFVGGVRSGKSALAQRWAEARSSSRLYVATCRAQDAEMAARVALHQKQRGQGWHCVEAPLDPVGAAERSLAGQDAGVLLLDCVSLWVANLLECGLEQAALLESAERLARWVRDAPRPVALVSGESGLGMVPLSAVGRKFQDSLGLVNQRLAAACSAVVFVSCGLPLALKGSVPEEIC